MGARRGTKAAASAEKNSAKDVQKAKEVEVETAVAPDGGAANKEVEGVPGAGVDEVLEEVEGMDDAENVGEDKGEKNGDKEEGEVVEVSSTTAAGGEAEEAWVVEEPEGDEEMVEILKAKQILMHGEHKYVQLHPSRFDIDANKLCNYRELLDQRCMEFKNLKDSMTSGWSPHNMGTFVYARKKDGTIITNEEGEYMFCAPDGQHRAMCQV